jgi:Protein of unknown function (DUF2948)
MPQGLRLRAVDGDDIAVISTILQDALVPVAEMAYLPDERRFVLVLNRFRWEPEEGPPREKHERTLTGLCIDGVTRVQRRGFSPADGERILVLLAIRAEGPTIFLDFSGDSSIRLDTDGFDCRLDDMGEPWPTKWRPRHDIAEKD